MAKTTDQITVDPQGQSMVVDIFDSNSVSVTCYTASGGSSAFTLPVTITTATTFYLTSGGYYSVSAKSGGVEIAGVGGQRATVQAAQGSPVTVTPVIDTVEELAQSAASGVPGVVVYTAWNADTTPASAGFYLPDGDNFPLVLGADTGIPWFRYGDGGDFGGFYVPADAKIGAELQVLTDGTAKAIVRMTTNGLFSVNVVNPAGLGGNPDNFVHSQGIFYGAPDAFCVNQAPPGWTSVTVEVQAGAAAITSIQGQFALL